MEGTVALTGGHILISCCPGNVEGTCSVTGNDSTLLLSSDTLVLNKLRSYNFLLVKVAKLNHLTAVSEFITPTA